MVQVIVYEIGTDVFSMLVEQTWGCVVTSSGNIQKVKHHNLT